MAEADANPGFAQRFMALRQQRGPFCLGLDPTPELLTAWGLPDDETGLARFCARVIEAAGEQLCVIKPQAAFFERFGAAGLRILEESVRAIQAAGTLALLDVKRGDIGSTSAAYADAWLGEGAALHGDAMTLHPYLGFGALRPFVARAAERGAGLFVVVLSSNPEGELIQNAQVRPGLSVVEHLADEISAANAALAGPQQVGPIGAVVGLTGSRVERLLPRLPRSLLLVPGLGAQGGSFEQLAERFAGATQRVLPSASRSVLACGPDAAALRAAIAEHCQRAAVALA